MEARHVKFLVITLLAVKESMQATTRCIASAKTFGIEAEVFPAVTGYEAEAVFAAHGWPTGAFTNNRYSRPLPCMGCFASHAKAWAKILHENVTYGIAEHDCVFVRPVPDVKGRGFAFNLGQPSYGRWNQPPCGIGAFVSGPHLKGAHCLLITPKAAGEFLKAAETSACPTDVFLSLKRFPWLKEVFPYPAECRSTFTTIQRPAGCVAKHDVVEIV